MIFGTVSSAKRLSAQLQLREEQRKNRDTGSSLQGKEHFGSCSIGIGIILHICEKGFLLNYFSDILPICFRNNEMRALFGL